MQVICIVCIDGREALPVRAIPYVTEWELSPDIVADALAQNNPDSLEERDSHWLAWSRRAFR